MSKVKWGNWIGFELLSFTIGLYNDPLKYVRQLKPQLIEKSVIMKLYLYFSLLRWLSNYLALRYEFPYP